MAKSSFYENSPQAPGPAPAQSPANVSNANTTAPSSFYKGTGPLVGNGGSLYDLTQYGVLYGDGILAPLATAAGVTGQILVAHTGAAPSFTSDPTINHSLTIGGFSQFILSGAGSRLQTTNDGTSSDNSWHASFIQVGNSGGGPAFSAYKTRGATPSSNGILVGGDSLFSIFAAGNDGQTAIHAAAIVMVVDGTPALGSMPTGISFQTSPANVGDFGMVERLFIDHLGHATFTGTGVEIHATASGPLDIYCDIAYYPSVNAKSNSQQVGWALTAKDSGGGNHTSYLLAHNAGMALQATAGGFIQFGKDNGSGSFVESVRIDGTITYLLDGLLSLRSPGDANHGITHSTTVDGIEFRGFSGFIWKNGSAGATELMRLDSGGNLALAGWTGGLAPFSGPSGGVPVLSTVAGCAAGKPSVSLFSVNNFPWLAELQFLKTRSDFANQFAVVSNGDWLLSITGYGADGSAYRSGVSIQGYVDGTPGANSMPGRLTFSTSPSGSSTVSERWRLDSTGQIIANLVGSTDIGAGNFFSANSTDGTNNPGMFAGNQYSADASPALIYLQKSRGTTVGTQTIVQAADILGQIGFMGSDGTSFRYAAQIRGLADVAPTAGQRIPGRLVFYTVNASFAVTERLRIDSVGLSTFTYGGTDFRNAIFTGGGTNGAGIKLTATGAGGNSWTLISGTTAGGLAGAFGIYSEALGKAVFVCDGSQNAFSTGTLGFGPAGAGVGGAVTQITSRTTGVTLNKSTGAITMFSAAGSATAATFTVTNSNVAANDTIILVQKSGTNLYEFLVTAVAAGSFNITFRTTGGTATDAPVINFTVIKGQNS